MFDRKEYNRLWREKNKEYAKEYRKQYNETHKKERRAHIVENYETVMMQKAKWRENNKEKINVYLNDYRKKLKEKEPFRILVSYFHINVRMALKKNYETSYCEYLGCTIKEYKAYLESKFQPGMTWENYGKAKKNEKRWQIDHIIPQSKFDLSNKENWYKCFNYKNTQPLWWEQNISKDKRKSLYEL